MGSVDLKQTLKAILVVKLTDEGQPRGLCSSLGCEAGCTVEVVKVQLLAAEAQLSTLLLLTRLNTNS